MVKKIRRRDESGRAGESERRSEGGADIPSGDGDENVEGRLIRDERFDEKKASSPGPSKT